VVQDTVSWARALLSYGRCLLTAVYKKEVAEKCSVGRRWASSSCVVTTIHGNSFCGFDTKGEPDPITSVNMSQALSNMSEELHFTSLFLRSSWILRRIGW